ncbi:PREDICTED: uncharacterized protein LOC107068731 [Polistes dominula]|uniref:Uncharacterized protein LOC107068731 n=1 Tax=Polistes dominula TaxID=743375 RepID=A0ABM1IL38_POLDO|nr:PREDICTED: uncharacterized protein LOC107068731 [Polistes dominula]
MLKKDRYLSVTITRIFMKFVGFWVVETKREQMLLYIALIYAILAIVFAICVEFADLYHCLGDFYALTYNLCATMLLIMILVKFGNFIYYRNIVLKLITYAEKNFWKVEYDNASAKILDEYDKRGVLMTYTFTVIVNLAAFNYIFAPLVENIGRNETDRVLPFKLWVDLPVKVTPYYEITYTIQAAEVLIRKCIFAIYFTGSLSQLLIYTWTCNDIIVQSSRLSESVYNSCWYLMPNEGKGKALKYGVSMIMLRSRRPCALTAGGFAVMSLETFTGILSTSMSYFTLLRQMSEEE